jgi:hypothetical protein
MTDLTSNSREDLLNSAGPRGSPGRKGIESMFHLTGLGSDTMQNNITELLHSLTRSVLPIPLDNNALLTSQYTNGSGKSENTFADQYAFV